MEPPLKAGLEHAHQSRKLSSFPFCSERERERERQRERQRLRQRETERQRQTETGREKAIHF